MSASQPETPFGLKSEKEYLDQGFILYLQDGNVELVITSKDDWSAKDRENCRDQMVSVFFDHVWRINNEKRLAEDQAREEREYAEFFSKKLATPSNPKDENALTKRCSPKVLWKGSCSAENQQVNYKMPSIKSDDITSGAVGAKGSRMEQQEDKETSQAELSINHKEGNAATEAERQYAENKDFGIIASASAFLAKDQGQKQQRWGKKLFVNDRKADTAAEARAMRMMQAEYEEAKVAENNTDSGFGDVDGAFGADVTATAAENTAYSYEVVGETLVPAATTNDGGT